MSDQEHEDVSHHDIEEHQSPPPRSLFGGHQTAFWRTMTDLDIQRDRERRRVRSQVDVNSWLDPALNFLRRHEERASGHSFDPLRLNLIQPSPTADAQLPIADIDFRGLEPISEPDSNLFCAICHCLLVDPLQLPCEHVFCSSCLKSSPHEHGYASGSALPCPSCRRSSSWKWIVKAPKLIERILDDVVVKCPSAGCEDTFVRSNVTNHISRYCQYTLVDCPSEDCELKIERRFSEAACLHQLQPCNDCSKEVMQLNLEKHRRNSCEAAYDECTGCKKSFRASEIKEHAELCEDIEVSCAGKEAGCKFTARRKDMSMHEASCLLAQASPFLSKQVARIDNHENTIKDLRLENRALADSITTMHSTIRDVLCDESNNNNGNADPQSSSAPPFDSQIAHVLELHTSLEDQVRRIDAAVASLDARLEIQILNQNLRASEEALHRDAVETQMRRQLQWLVSAKLQSQRAASSLLRAAGQDPPSVSGAAEAGPSAPRTVLGRRRSDEDTGARDMGSMPLRRSSDGGREKL